MIRNRNMVFKDAKAASPDVEKYLVLPKIALASLPTAATANKGGISYDTTNNVIVFSNGSSWAEVGA